MREKLLPGLVSLGLFFVMLLHPAQGQEVMNVGDVAYKQHKGMPVKLSQYAGKWIVLNYWATWCPPCRAEMPELQNFHDKNKDIAVVLGVNYEIYNAEKIQNFLDEYLLSFPILYEMKEVDGVNTALGLPLKGLPTTFMINPKGELVARRTGPVDAQLLEDFIKQQSK